jgi:hypothetical protein
MNLVWGPGKENWSQKYSNTNGRGICAMGEIGWVATDDTPSLYQPQVQARATT